MVKSIEGRGNTQNLSTLSSCVICASTDTQFHFHYIDGEYVKPNGQISFSAPKTFDSSERGEG